MGYVLSGEGIVSLSIVGITCCHVEALRCCAVMSCDGRVWCL